ncbi:hypothetical protein PVAP13_1KG458350 [Panicum virgatum]|uniref:Uncharacterized protein n=1 Tax=Panicum virgatum TaxID=38727 RepID=A0A8T0XNU6_PANVG|nr:hypothetical protein PVAP13_1KG458350 [Panicum virgatum]
MDGVLRLARSPPPSLQKKESATGPAIRCLPSDPVPCLLRPTSRAARRSLLLPPAPPRPTLSLSRVCPHHPSTLDLDLTVEVPCIPPHEGGSSRAAGAASSVGSEAVAGGSGGGGGDQPSSWSRPAPTLSTASRSTRAARAAASAFSRIARTPISAPPPTSSSLPLAPQPTRREELGFQTTAGAPTAGERRRWSLRRSGFDPKEQVLHRSKPPMYHTRFHPRINCIDSSSNRTLRLL